MEELEIKQEFEELWRVLDIILEILENHQKTHDALEEILGIEKEKEKEA